MRFMVVHVFAGVHAALMWEKNGIITNVLNQETSHRTEAKKTLFNQD